MILREVRSIKEVLILLRVLVEIFRLDMIAETISIREQQLSLVTILRLDILIVELVQWETCNQFSLWSCSIHVLKDSDSLSSLYQFNDITATNFNFKKAVHSVSRQWCICRRHENRNWVTIVKGGLIYSIWDTPLFLDWAKECSVVSRHLFPRDLLRSPPRFSRQYCNLGRSPWSRCLPSVGFAHARFDWVDMRVREFYWWPNSPFVSLCNRRSCKERWQRKHGGHVLGSNISQNSIVFRDI